jgi:hypothetical protein
MVRTSNRSRRRNLADAEHSVMVYLRAAVDVGHLLR